MPVLISTVQVQKCMSLIWLTPQTVRHEMIVYNQNENMWAGVECSRLRGRGVGDGGQDGPEHMHGQHDQAVHCTAV